MIQFLHARRYTPLYKRAAFFSDQLHPRNAYYTKKQDLPATRSQLNRNYAATGLTHADLRTIWRMKFASPKKHALVYDPRYFYTTRRSFSRSLAFTVRYFIMKCASPSL